jgi:hypothetical protein
MELLKINGLYSFVPIQEDSTEIFKGLYSAAALKAD